MQCSPPTNISLCQVKVNIDQFLQQTHKKWYQNSMVTSWIDSYRWQVNSSASCAFPPLTNILFSWNSPSWRSLVSNVVHKRHPIITNSQKTVISTSFEHTHTKTSWRDFLHPRDGGVVYHKAGLIIVVDGGLDMNWEWLVQIMSFKCNWSTLNLCCVKTERNSSTVKHECWKIKESKKTVQQRLDMLWRKGLWFKLKQEVEELWCTYE